MNQNEIAYLVVPIPEDVQQAKLFGDFDLARRLIQNKLSLEKTSQVLKNRLEAELAILTLLEENQYPFTETEALQQMRRDFSDFKDSELGKLLESCDVSWIYINGEKHYHKRFVENLVKTRQDYYQRYLQEEENNIDNERQTELDANIAIMKENGSRKARITLRQAIKPKVACAKEEGPFLAHLPLPRANGFVEEIRILATKGEVCKIDPEDTKQRTIAFKTEDNNQLDFSVTHTYEINAVYCDLYSMCQQAAFPKDLTQEEKVHYQEALQEKKPHILFTPFLKALLEEITDKEMTLLQKAWAIYSFVTTKVNYSYMREYYTIPNISEYAAVNQKGDCGVQALLFITLCRMAGIPAKWESGLYVSEYTQGPHDWAAFYLPTMGWLYADVSFGGSAYRGGNESRWHYYFGNLDVFRMPANDDIQAAFCVPKQFLRADPIDNQRGEFESSRRGFYYSCLEIETVLEGFEFL